jgi:hypothetical protein
MAAAAQVVAAGTVARHHPRPASSVREQLQRTGHKMKKTTGQIYLVLFQQPSSDQLLETLPSSLCAEGPRLGTSANDVGSGSQFRTLAQVPRQLESALPADRPQTPTIAELAQSKELVLRAAFASRFRLSSV